MIEYSDDVMKKSRNLKIRFSLVKMKDQCESKIQNFNWNHVPFSDMMEWQYFKIQFNNLLCDYDNGIKLNEELILKLNDIKFNDNLITIKRLIKLIKIVVRE